MVNILSHRLNFFLKLGTMYKVRCNKTKQKFDKEEDPTLKQIQFQLEDDLLEKDQ